MNDGGSVPSGNQSTSGGSGASFLNPPKNPTPPSETPTAPVRIHILGQEISDVVDTPTPTSPPEPIIDDSRPVLDLSNILNDTPPPPDPAPQPPAPLPEPEPEPEPVEQPPETPTEDQPQKSHKSLIITSVIAFIAILLIAIIAVVIFVVTRPKELSPIEVAFNTYANNLIHGTHSSDSLETLPAANQFYYHQKLGGDSGFDQTYIDQLSQEYDNFYNLLSPDLSVYASATNYQQLLNFLKLDPSGDRYSEDTLTSKYLNGGESSVSSYIKKTLATLPESNPYATEFRSLKQNEFGATLDYLLFLDSAGCIDSDNKTIDDYCANSLDLSMQNDPEKYYYHDATSDDTASYFQDDTEDPSSTNSSDSSDSSLYRTPYTVMHENADLAKNLLDTDFNLLGENFPTLKNALNSSK